MPLAVPAQYNVILKRNKKLKLGPYRPVLRHPSATPTTDHYSCLLTLLESHTIDSNAAEYDPLTGSCALFFVPFALLAAWESSLTDVKMVPRELACGERKT